MKKRSLFVLLLALPLAALSEPKFNALDATDPHYAEYQQALCKSTLEMSQRLDADKYWLDTIDPKLGGKSADQREAWVIDYVITAALRDSYRQRYEVNCTAVAHEQ